MKINYIDYVSCKELLGFNYTRAYTHGGIFHADDVFSYAFIRMINPSVYIMRGTYDLKLHGIKDEKSIDPDNTLVFDIGGGKFDHHGKDMELRINSVPYAAFGKLWREFAPLLFGDFVYKKVDSSLVQEIDMYDNGVQNAQSNISRFIHNLNPTWEEETLTTEKDIAHRYFMKAVDFADSILRREIEVAQAIEDAKEFVTKAILEREYNEILVLDKYAPWIGEALKYQELLFCIFPSSRNNGKWNLQVIPKEVNTREPRLDVPNSWKGYNDKSKAPVDGMTFCHQSGFLSEFETLEQAIAAARSLIKK